ncbi:MAG: helix-turn-helix transcriptional regulator [Clostridia bacterium]|nr:helix-turn-helix transcriptional regulator [Clostridia bacterium]
MRKLDFAERIRNLRSEMDLTQWQLADVLETTQRKISYWELGKTQPDLLTLWKIADFFDVSVDYLLGRKDV